MAELPILFQNAVEVTGERLRHAFDRPLGEGVEGYTDLLVTPGAAANTVDVAAGAGFVRGDGLNDLGLYRVRNDATKNSAAFTSGAISAPHATNPRLDQIIARVYDHEVDGSGKHSWELAVLTGTATLGATLDNRNGAAALPNSAMLIADVLIPAGASAVIPGANIRDRRPFCHPIVPPLFTDVDMVPLVPLGAPQDVVTYSEIMDLKQSAIACYLPSRISGATRIRWRYRQQATALTGSYALAIFDASGRLVVSTGSVAFTGAGSTAQARSEAIPATTLEAGVYYVFFGLDSTNTGIAEAPSSRLESVGAAATNLACCAAAGGTTVPTTLLGMEDAATSTVIKVGVPHICLSVG